MNEAAFAESVSITMVQPGDKWVSDKDTVEIDEVAEYVDETDGVMRYRIVGRITRGWGKSQKRRTWVFPPTQVLGIVRRKE